MIVIVQWKLLPARLRIQFTITLIIPITGYRKKGNVGEFMRKCHTIFSPIDKEAILRDGEWPRSDLW